jgi:hypothetical protein
MRTIAIITAVALAALAAACSGGDSPKPTPTLSQRDITAAYFRALSQSIDQAFAVPTDPADPTPVPETTALTEPTVLALQDDPSQLRQFQAALEAVPPPPAASAAHQALLQATRDLIAQQDAAATTTPANEATATAITRSAEQRFHDACVALAVAGQDADSPVELPCPAAEPTLPPPAEQSPAPEETQVP